ncbi:MAG: hypothetical protein EAZ44_02050 [Cytophagia bacterium]|nr:MAG: hypothetical protein EAZ44_02050 [Cytophagia bacterium]TAG42717.1 MAG: hypothetical protein EAZ31_05580 [Cytophagia bacterium]
MDAKFKKEFQEAIHSQIPDFLQQLKEYYQNVNPTIIGRLKEFANDFSNPVANFRLADWKAQVLVFIQNNEDLDKHTKTINITDEVLFDLLDEAFDDDGIQTFCFKYFSVVSNNFSGGHNKTQKIITLITHSKNHLQIDFLLEKIKKERPAMYQKHIS